MSAGRWQPGGVCRQQAGVELTGLGYTETRVLGKGQALPSQGSWAALQAAAPQGA